MYAVEVYWPLFIILFFAFSVQSMAGFGSNIIAVSLSVFILPLKDFLPILIMLNTIQVAFMVLINLSELDMQLVFRIIFPAYFLGLPLGYYLFQMLPVSILIKVFAFMVIVLSLYSLSIMNRNKLEGTQPASKIWLYLSGIAHGMFATGGPFLVYYVTKLGLDKLKFRTMLLFFWLIVDIALLLIYFITGKLSSTALLNATTLLPSIAIAVFVGDALQKKVSQQSFRRNVYYILLVCGFLLMLK